MTMLKIPYEYPACEPVLIQVDIPLAASFDIPEIPEEEEEW
jgi:hypothetical protein